MIHDARVLQDDFVPHEVVHRHEEMNRLSAALEPVIHGDRPEDALLFGPSGAGKTCIARHALAELESEILDVTTQYVDCWQHSNHYRILYKLLEGVETTHDVHRSTPKHELLARLESLDGPYIVILDEVDQLTDTDVLRELYGIPHLSTILIANRAPDLLGTLDERLQSRLRSSLQLTFDQYSDDELVAILADRVEWGLDPAAVSTAHLERIADAAAGNARDAIGILRSAARNAEHEGATTIDDAHVETAIPTARRQRHRKDLQKLTDHQRSLYDLLDADGPLSPRELFARYRSAVDDPRTKRTFRSYLGKLEQYNLVEGSGSGPSREYRALSGE
jgi:cell division control protein 6